MRYADPKSVIDPSATVHPTAIIGLPPQYQTWLAKGVDWHPAVIAEGCRIGAYSLVDGGTEGPTMLERNVFLMSQSHIGHDCVVGEGSEIAAGSIVAGHVRFGKYVLVGVAAVFKPFVEIGEGARIGCGAVVIRDVPAGEVWAGNPARKVGEHENNRLLPGERHAVFVSELAEAVI